MIVFIVTVMRTSNVILCTYSQPVCSSVKIWCSASDYVNSQRSFWMFAKHWSHQLSDPDVALYLYTESVWNRRPLRCRQDKICGNWHQRTNACARNATAINASKCDYTICISYIKLYLHPLQCRPVGPSLRDIWTPNSEHLRWHHHYAYEANMWRTSSDKMATSICHRKVIS
jgi:hypothetical protein